MYWIRDKETFLMTDDAGRDLEHVLNMQRKFDDFQKVLYTMLASYQFRLECQIL